MSVFGEVGIPLTDRLTFTPGIRVGHDEVKRQGLFTSNGTPGVVPSFSDHGEFGDSFAAGGVTLDYKLDATSLVYASIKRGYSNGGFAYFNQNAPFGIPAEPYPSSYSWTYEAGARTTLPGGRLSLEGSVFYNDVKDGHVYTFDPIGNFFAIRALDYRTYGFEAAMRARLTDEVKTYGGVGFVHTGFVNVPLNDPTGAKNGGSLPGVPRWSGVFGLEHGMPLGRFGLAGTLVSSAELQLGDIRPADVPNTFNLKSYAIVNAKIAWEKDALQAYIFGRNLSDQRVEVAGVLYGPGIETVTLGLGRVVGIGAEMKF
jgi:iron complex outermembrane recepter protein